jgi:hypothetical protein
VLCLREFVECSSELLFTLDWFLGIFVPTFVLFNRPVVVNVAIVSFLFVFFKVGYNFVLCSSSSYGVNGTVSFSLSDLVVSESRFRITNSQKQLLCMPTSGRHRGRVRSVQSMRIEYCRPLVFLVPSTISHRNRRVSQIHTVLQLISAPSF